jgi:hypothetical protein
MLFLWGKRHKIVTCIIDQIGIIIKPKSWEESNSEMERRPQIRHEMNVSLCDPTSSDWNTCTFICLHLVGSFLQGVSLNFMPAGCSNRLQPCFANQIGATKPFSLARSAISGCVPIPADWTSSRGGMPNYDRHFFANEFNCNKAGFRSRKSKTASWALILFTANPYNCVFPCSQKPYGIGNN